ncbi:MAG: hypothetical protein H8D67_27505 [Deltaproteobacteria bacterium]|nr:hypothetical protein [Deltaproteobacteria bacterium]MBL7224929.1 hypothetical protein [Desulfobacteraceae bacterium]
MKSTIYLSLLLIIRGTQKHQIADGLDLLFIPTYMEMIENRFMDYQMEIKYPS